MSWLGSRERYRKRRLTDRGIYTRRMFKRTRRSIQLLVGKNSNINPSKKQNMTQKTVAEIFVETLIATGVTRIYGVVGDSLNGILEEIRRSKKIEWIGVRHEETGAFAACAQAHLTGELAVFAGNCGSCNIHLINGIFDWHRSPAPELGLTGAIPHQEVCSN